MNGPDNREKHGKFIAVTPPDHIDPEHHLDELVKLGALKKQRYHFPDLKATEENTLAWMEFANKHHKLVLWATAPGDTNDGANPLEFTLCYLPQAQAKVDAFVAALLKKPKR